MSFLGDRRDPYPEEVLSESELDKLNGVLERTKRRGIPLGLLRHRSADGAEIRSPRAIEKSKRRWWQWRI